MPENEMSKEEVLKALAGELKEEMAKREKREIFDRVLCAVTTRLANEAPEVIFTTTKRIVDRRQTMLDAGEL